MAERKKKMQINIVGRSFIFVVLEQEKSASFVGAYAYTRCIVRLPIK